MSTISSSTSYSTSRGMSGLVSGLDTESMVDKLLSGTQAKIDKQNGNKQQLVWKQDAYREVISLLTGFQDKFFNFLNPSSNLLSNSFFNAMSVTSKSTAVKVTANNNASAGKITINQVKQLATASKYESHNKTSSDLKGKLDPSKVADLEKGATVDVTLDGVKKTITIKGTTEDEVFKSLEDGLRSAFGTANIGVTKNGSEILFTCDETSQVTVSASGGNTGLEALGLQNNQSNKMNPQAKLKDLNLGVPLQGSHFEFTINGKTITASSEDTMQDVMDRINGSGAGVKVTYSSIHDKFSIESTETGAGRDIAFSQGTGNLLTAMFGINGSGSIKGLPISHDSITAGGAIDADAEANGFPSGSTFTITVNGKENKFTLKSKDDASISFDDAITEINSWLGSQYGTTGTGDAKTNHISIQKNVDGKMELSASQGYKVSIPASGEDISVKMGFTAGQNNTLEPKDKLVDLGVTGEINGITITADMTFEQFAEQLQTKLQLTDAGAKVVANEDGSLSVTGNVTLTGTAVSHFFGQDSVNLSTSGGSDKPFLKQAGTNAEIVMGDGTVIQRSTNSFVLDGVGIELLEETKVGDAPIEIGVSRNTDQILSGIKGFVEEYNTMIDKLHKMVNQDATYRKYPPLSAAQKKEMTEKEIAAWEEKSKEGLLRNDPILNGILNDMRTALYQKPEDGKFALYDLGITTGGWQENGKLHIQDEAKLKELIENNSVEIEKLFTDSEKGIAAQMNKILDKAAKKSTASPGSLVQMAGIKGWGTDSSNTLAKQMKGIDQILESLNRTYESEKTRYWKQFNTMEKVLSTMNQQSSWLASQFS